jgi:hypothetical protein
MAKKPRESQKFARRQRLAPSRHTIAKQSAAVLALGLGLAAGGQAEASIVYTPVGTTIHDGESLDFLMFNGANQFRTYLGTSLDFASAYGIAGVTPLNYRYMVVKPSPPASAPDFADRLISGTQISWPDFPTLYRDNAYLVNTGSSGYWLGQTGYLGLIFSDGTDYFNGWAQLSVASDLSSLTLIKYAYESDANVPIKAGAVPLPGSLTLLATGAAGLLAYRRMKRAA